MKTFKLDAEIGQKSEDVHFLGFHFKTIGPDSLEAFLKDCAVGEKVKIEINSPGGSVIAGLAMANMVKNSKAHVIGHVVGVAASMASVVACACDEVKMEEAAFLMIHNPWSEAEGDAEELKHAADVLERMEVAMRAFYRGKFPNMADAELDQLMADETWMTGADCVARGMVCELVPSDVRAAACVTRRHFKHIPEAAAKFLEIHEAKEAPADAASATAAAPAESAEPKADDWEARYKGAMRKMNEKADEIASLRAQLDAVTNTATEARSALDAAKGALDAARAQITDLTSQLDATRGDLEKAKADLSSAVQRAENAEKDLARKGEQISQLEQAHALLTGGVLKPGGENAEAEYEAAMKKAGSAEAREKLRKAHAKGKK